MAIASGSGRRVAFIAESAFGTTPTTPAFKLMRITGGGIRTNKSTKTSDEIQSDRNVRDELLLGIDASGAYNFELSYGMLDDLIAGALFSTWSTDAIVNGVTAKSFTVEEFLEMGATDSFSRFTGAMVNTLSLAISARQIVTGSIGFMGVKETLDTAIISGATYGTVPDYPVVSASANVADLSVASGTPKVRSLNIEINNNLRSRPIVGSKYSEQFGAGRCEVTGTIDAYFESNALYQSVLDHGGGAVEVTLGVDTTEKYTITLPNVIFGNGERQPGGNDDDVMVNIPFRAVYDSGIGGTIKVERAVA